MAPKKKASAKKASSADSSEVKGSGALQRRRSTTMLSCASTHWHAQDKKKDGAPPAGDVEGASIEELNQKIGTLEKEKNKEEEYRNYMQLERVSRWCLRRAAPCRALMQHPGQRRAQRRAWRSSSTSTTSGVCFAGGSAPRAVACVWKACADLPRRRMTPTRHRTGFLGACPCTFSLAAWW